MEIRNAPKNRIPLKSLLDLVAIGRRLPFDLHDANGRLLLGNGQLITTSAQIDLMLEREAWAEASDVEQFRPTAASQGEVSTVNDGFEVPISIFDRWERKIWDLDKLLRAASRAQISRKPLDLFCERLAGLIDKDADVAVFASIRRDDVRVALYPLIHSLSCAVLCVLTARRLGWPANEIKSISCAALTMNISIIGLQATMAEQLESPTDEQMRFIKSHPANSASQLRKIGVRDEFWLQSIEQHHERDDGKGYPAGRRSLFKGAQLLRMVDIFVAKITPRKSRPAFSPQEAIVQIKEESLKSNIAKAFLELLGANPIGSVVELNSGELAVVIRKRELGAEPLVATISDERKALVSVSHLRDTSRADARIVAHASTDRQLNINHEQVYGWIPG